MLRAAVKISRNMLRLPGMKACMAGNPKGTPPIPGAAAAAWGPDILF